MKRWNMIRQAVLVQKMSKSEARQTFNVSRTDFLCDAPNQFT